MKKLWMLIPLVLLIGCSMTQVRQTAINWSESDIKNVTALKIVSTKIKTTWNFYSGALEAIEDDLSGKSNKLKKELDKLYASGKWDDKAMGKTLVLRTLLVIDIGKQKIEKLLPGFLSLLSSF